MSTMPDELNPPSVMKKLKKEAQERLKNKELPGVKFDPELVEIVENFDKDSKAELVRLFYWGKLSPYQYCLLNLLSELVRKKKK